MPERTKHFPLPTLDGELSRLQRIAQLENAPMRRYTPTSTSAETARSGCSCCGEELSALLARQNELLCDILGAVNALTASQLAQSRKEPKEQKKQKEQKGQEE